MKGKKERSRRLEKEKYKNNLCFYYYRLCRLSCSWQSKRGNKQYIYPKESGEKSTWGCSFGTGAWGMVMINLSSKTVPHNDLTVLLVLLISLPVLLFYVIFPGLQVPRKREERARK